MASTYPIVCGPEASDYSLSLETIYCNISYNSTSGNYSFAGTTDSLGQIYHEEETSIPFGHPFLIYNKISANNSNPLMSYDNQIFLSISADDRIITSLSRPVIKVGQSSGLEIQFEGKPNIGLYPIKVRGIGGDGKMREAMMVIGISFPSRTTGGGYTYDISTAGTPAISEFIGSTPIGGSSVYTPTRPINITFFSSFDRGLLNNSSTSRYSGNTGSYTPSYLGNTESYAPSYLGNTKSNITPTATYASNRVTPTATYT